MAFRVLQCLPATDDFCRIREVDFAIAFRQVRLERRIDVFPRTV